MNKKKYKYLFGPVASRRLGLSLGVDLVPYKTCTMDCVYCESGKTTNLRTERDEFFSTVDIIAELDDFLSTKPELDYITFSGAGEPTLHSGIGKIIKFVKTNYPAYKLALLTNSMLMMDANLFEEIKPVDLIVPSLDSVFQSAYSTINKPSSQVSCDDLIEVLAKFKRESRATFYLEIFVIPEINNSQEAIDAMVDAIAKIQPDVVQLNTLDRPGVEDWVKPATLEELELFATNIAKVATVEVVGKFKKEKIKSSENNLVFNKSVEDEILSLIERRPSTSVDISIALRCDKTPLIKFLKTLVAEGKITVTKRTRGTFYKKK